MKPGRLKVTVGIVAPLLLIAATRPRLRTSDGIPMVFSINVSDAGTRTPISGADAQIGGGMLFMKFTTDAKGHVEIPEDLAGWQFTCLGPFVDIVYASVPSDCNLVITADGYKNSSQPLSKIYGSHHCFTESGNVLFTDIHMVSEVKSP